MFKAGSPAGGRYTVIREIGRGGTGVVYLVIQNVSAKLWAMKAVPLAEGDGAAEAVCGGQELMLLKRLRFPGLPELTDVFKDRNCLCMVMTLIEGRTLLQVAKDHQKAEGMPYDAGDILQWGSQLCGILGYLHERPQPVIYMDLKPSNVMLTADGTIYLVDLGASVMLHFGGISARRALTPSYAAPEVLQGQMPGPRSDIFGIGRLLSDMACGLLPEKKKAGAAQLAALEPVITRCTMTDPSKRYASCRELADALAQSARQSRAALRHLHSRRQAAAAVMILGLLAAGRPLLRYGGEGKTQQIYAAMIESAEGLPAKDMKTQLTEAAALMPEKAETYCLLVERLSADGVLEAKDLEDIRALLYAGDEPGSPDHLSRLKEDPEEFSEFAWCLGTALYEYADTPENAHLSDYWFARMQDASAELTGAPWPVRKKYAGQILEMNRCRRVLGGQIAGPDEAARLWNAMTALADMAGEQDLSRSCRIHIIGDVSVSLYDHASLLLQMADVTVENQKALLMRLGEKLTEMEPFGTGEMQAAGTAGEMLSMASDELKMLEE